MSAFGFPPYIQASTDLPASVGPARAGISPSYAPADHRHGFGPALQFTRSAVPSNGTLTWTFSTPFVDAQGNPVNPILMAIVESPSGTMIFQEPQVTALSNTAVTFQLRAQPQTISLVGLTTLTLGAGGVPTGTFLHITARNPSS